MKKKASVKKKMSNGIKRIVIRSKKSVWLTARQIKITHSLIEMAEMHLSQFDTDCARMFGWKSKPRHSIEEYMKDVAEIKEIFYKKKGAEG